MNELFSPVAGIAGIAALTSLVASRRGRFSGIPAAPEDTLED